MEEDELDPRIQVELEKLNTATDEINRLEIELDEANTTFRMLLGECTRRLKVHSGKHGSAIVNARPYYEALDAARNAQQECQKAAVGFQRANEIHEAAKETVALAETRFLSQPDWRFDSAWQEMLNHATLKVRDAEKNRAESATQHGAATARYKEAQDKVHSLEQRLKRSVAKSRPYFEEKARCNDQLAAQKEVVESLQRCVGNIKRDYANSLRRLEGISEEIHRKRADILGACPGIREPGVGAELEYRGELDRCDVQSGASNPLSVQSEESAAYDSRSDCSSLRSELLEGETLVEGCVEGREIREAVVVSVGEMVAKPTTSTKQTQQLLTSTDLTEDFRRAQIGTLSPFEAEHSRYKDYFEPGGSKTRLSNAAGSSKHRDPNEYADLKHKESFVFRPEGSKLEDLNEYQDLGKKDAFVHSISKETSSNLEGLKDIEHTRLKNSQADDACNNAASSAAGDFKPENSNESKKSPQQNSSELSEVSKLHCSVDGGSSNQGDRTDFKHGSIGNGSEKSLSKAAGDSKREDSKEINVSKHTVLLKSAVSQSEFLNMKEALDQIRESGPKKDSMKCANEDIIKRLDEDVTEDVKEGARIAQDEEVAGKGNVSIRESGEERRDKREESVETTKTIEREDNNEVDRGTETLQN